jgi:hypothetical protein
MFVMFVGAAALPGQSPNQSQFVGKWNLTGTGEHSRYIYFLDVKENNGQLEASFLNRSSHATPVAWIRVEGNELVWQYGPGETAPKPACGPIYRGKLEGSGASAKLVGSHTLNAPGEISCAGLGRRAGGGGAGANAPAGDAARGGAAPAAPAAAPATPAPAKAAAPKKAPSPPMTVNWVGVKAPVFPAANANGNHTYGTPIVVVGPGVGKETWTGNTPDTWQTRCEDRWTIVDGAITNGNPPAQGETSTCNIYTKATAKDFKVEAEIKLDAGQNSGFYIRGRHELQLSLPNPNATGRGGPGAYPGQLMDIYGWKRADAPEPKPAGEWQKLDAIVVGDRITVMFNDKKVHDNAQLYAWTGGALDANVDQPGPIMIQGDHSRVTIRKLVITPITRAGM